MGLYKRLKIIYSQTNKIWHFYYKNIQEISKNIFIIILSLVSNLYKNNNVPDINKFELYDFEI